MKSYDVVINGIATTLRLSDADAKARGLLTDAPEPKKAPAKAPAKAAPKSRTPANKSRQPADK